MSNAVAVCPSKRKTRELSLKERITNRDFLMHKLWTNGTLTLKGIASRFETCERTIKRRIKLVENKIGTYQMEQDIAQSLADMGPEATAGLRVHVNRGNLEAILNVLRHLGMGQGGGDSGYTEITDVELFIEEQTEMREILAKDNGNGSANGSGTPISLSTNTKRTRISKKTVRRQTQRKA